MPDMCQIKRYATASQSHQRASSLARAKVASTQVTRSVHLPPSGGGVLGMAVGCACGTVPAMTSEEKQPSCPECEQPLSMGAMALCKREDDGARVCRGVWGCGQGHVWWKWADRPADPLEVCPHPELFTG
ncbi:hypothetical protein GCM10009663_35280 [Kitasatospora arboriphila]|uniref:Dehydrogenase n=1 Tax=Kitasatospora arboriphila TaxID=258052 RepID=A0ABP4E2B5_9ACTN